MPSTVTTIHALTANPTNGSVKAAKNHACITVKVFRSMASYSIFARHATIPLQIAPSALEQAFPGPGQLTGSVGDVVGAEKGSARREPKERIYKSWDCGGIE